ncbi:LysM peptidoglycan-binding domain-containing protein [Aliishimia ponticola]|uniref:LysM peptidoglycan-binding domain-containing protein n=1 Tax=Aliishimia ponticola TaxID=2499833 RepID=A0A4V3XKY6_9RHOB|nr:peptidoglycan DD-metalloendopeptidase family protein [Aliishimia ponticola]THH38793.1 LysM peptidoglycan-binding domain-containing protein [Aliishimia ponticola]
MTHPFLRSSVAILALSALAACEDGLDFDLRGGTGSFTTAQAAQQATAARPQPDNRGIISYPNYQVAVARRGDTVADVASRIGSDADALAKFNGLPIDATLRAGEIIALPGRVAEPSPATGAAATGPIRPASDVDVTTLAGQAIDNSAQTTPSTTTTTTQPVAQTGEEPIRHKVVRGETAYSVARLYNVPVRSLARWNSLGPQYAIREGQYLLIPVAEATPPATAATTAEATTAPGEGSPTPQPPSAAKPLPKEDVAPAASPKPAPPAPKPDLGAATKPAPSGQLAYPVQGTIIRDYAKGRNDGINIKGAAGGAVKAADAGTVAAITESADGVPIIVVRHQDNLLTVYANVTDVSVKKGDQVRRGQGLAKLRQGDQSFVHFEVRKGFESVDPNDYLN